MKSLGRKALKRLRIWSICHRDEATETVLRRTRWGISYWPNSLTVTVNFMCLLGQAMVPHYMVKYQS